MRRSDGKRTSEGASVEIEFPVEFLVLGTPVSAQAKRRESIDQWQARIKDASQVALPEGHFATRGPIAIRLFYFPAAAMTGDIDNIVKPILDALRRYIYLDDRQIERLVVQKFEPERVFQFRVPSAILSEALDADRPLLYVRLSDDPYEDEEFSDDSAT
jgi:hypothetical protein